MPIMEMPRISLMVALKALIEFEYNRLGNWAEMEAKYKVNKGILWKIVHKNYRPGAVILRRLGFRKKHKDLYSMPVDELRWRLQNREVLQERNKEDEK